MGSLQARMRIKNEATGMRVVSQYVQEFWECGWQPFDARNDRGIDGLVLMRRKNQDLGVKVNIQVKCGSKYVSSENSTEIRISIDDQTGLEEHIQYWRNQVEPAFLVFVNPEKPVKDRFGNIVRDEKGQIIWKETRLNARAWWADLKSDSLRVHGTKTLIRIPKKNVFGEHSKGDFLRFAKPLLSIGHLPLVEVDEAGKKLLNSTNLKVDARTFYKGWSSAGEVPCKALGKNVRVSKTGWNHILSSRRGSQRRSDSLRLLRVAKQMIDEVEKESCFLLSQTESAGEIEQKFGIRAKYQDRFGYRSVQVIILRRYNPNTGNEKLWFYSVHYRGNRRE